MPRKYSSLQRRVLIAALVSGMVFTTSEVLADEAEINIVTKGDLYVKSKVPIPIFFEVTATDKFSNEIKAQCDRTSNSVFNMGKTTVRCIANDSLGNEARDSFVVTVGYNIVQIPNWFKQTTEFWTSQNMTDTEYIQMLNFLFDEQIIHVPHTKSPKHNADADIPVWIKTSAQKWVGENMTDDEFSIGIQWMLDQGIIRK